MRKEVWETLGAVGSHANIAKNNCYMFYKPRMERDGGIYGGMRIPEVELKETAPLKNKWRKYTRQSYSRSLQQLTTPLLDLMTLRRSWNWNQ